MDKLPESPEINEGGLRKQLKLKKDEKFKIGELAKVRKVKMGNMFDFRGKQFKMTPLLRKRVVLALAFMRLPKGKNAGKFAKKNKGKKPSDMSNPIDRELLSYSLEASYPHSVVTIEEYPNRAVAVQNAQGRNGLVFKGNQPNTWFTAVGTRDLGGQNSHPMSRDAVYAAALAIDSAMIHHHNRRPAVPFVARDTQGNDLGHPRPNPNTHPMGTLPNAANNPRNNRNNNGGQD